MPSTRELLINRIGIVVSIIGGIRQDLIIAIVGLSFLFLQVIVRTGDVEDEVKIKGLAEHSSRITQVMA